MTTALVHHGPRAVAAVPHGRDAGPEVPVEAVLDHRVEVLGAEAGEAVERAVLGEFVVADAAAVAGR